MKSIVLQKLELRNFKGKQNEVFEFNNETSLYGDNGTGKTTVGADALPWLFFGKNSADETKFNVKTLDPSGVRIPNIETSVKGWFLIDGEQEVFERVLFEKWVKKHGTTTKEYTGDETNYFINAAPKKKKEFDEEVGSIISTSLFKLLTNPLEFNRLPWEKRREVLIKMAGDVTDENALDSIITVTNKGDYTALINALNKNGIETYKSELKGKIKLNKDQLQNIPSRIDEVHRSKPEILNWNELEGQIKDKKERIVQIDAALSNEAEKLRIFNEGQQEIQKQIGEKQLELQKLESELKIEANKDLHNLKNKYSDLETELENLENEGGIKDIFINNKETELDRLKKDRESLLSKYAEIQKREFYFDETKSICPTCKQSLPENEIESQKQTLLENFNTTKANDRELNMQSGLKIKSQIEQLEIDIKGAKEVLESIKTKIPEVEKQLAEIDIKEKPVDFSMEKDWNDLHDSIQDLKNKINQVQPAGNTELIGEKSALETEIKAIEKQLNGKEAIEKADARIAELQADQTKYAQAIADLEKEESIVLEFEKTKMNMLEANVNSKFQLVKFRMFEPQKNGGEKPNCITLINGVPYSDANTASKINAGIDIINVLSEFFEVQAPIIVDNRESVTELLPVKSQIINLVKDSNYKTLTVK
jgi:DNA repair exonuclease SbcCD ATPase subunit